MSRWIRWHRALLALSLCLSLAGGLHAEERRLPAFPGAEGSGAYTPGGRGGKVCLVTTLEDYIPGKQPVIPGSLRAAVEAKEPRIVVFRVSGYIALKTNLTVRNPYITIAGQTAPGEGVCLRNYQVAVGGTHDCIVRHLRCRTGDETSKASELDALTLWDSKNVIFDHCSATWSTDECLSVTNASDNVTVQWCIIAEGLTKHSYGSIIGSYDGKITFHHNLYANNVSRNPRPGGYNYVKRHEKDAGPHIDFRNNVIYNWASLAGYTGSGKAEEVEKTAINFVANYLKPGPSTPEIRRKTAFTAHQGSEASMYVGDNYMEGFPEGSADNWLLIDCRRCGVTRLANPFPVAPVKTDDAKAAYEKVIANVGPTLPVRDAVDSRIVEDARNGAGKVVMTLKDLGGWPAEYRKAEAPADSDSDGMPDEWERKYGLNPNDSTDTNKDADGDGYTNIEEYINGTNPLAPEKP